MSLYQPPPPQVVLMTNCEKTEGFPEVLREMMKHLGFRHQPEYTVIEDYRHFNQEYYRAIVRIRQDVPLDNFPVHKAVGRGHTIGVAIQQVGYMCVTLLRTKYDRLYKGPFMYIPKGYIGSDGQFFTFPAVLEDKEPYDVQGICKFSVAQEYMVENLRAEANHYHEQLWIALRRLSGMVDAGIFEEEVRCPPRPPAPHLFKLFEVDGYIPARGAPRVLENTYRPRQSLYGEQGPDAYEFPYPPQALDRF